MWRVSVLVGVAACVLGCTFDTGGATAADSVSSLGDAQGVDLSGAPPMDSRVDRLLVSTELGAVDQSTIDQGVADKGVVDKGAAVPDQSLPDKGVPDAPVKPDTFKCPSGYTLKSAGSCHKHVTNNADWLSAEKSCEQDGAHLVVVNNSQENSSLPNNVWIGISERVTAGVYLTVTGIVQPFTAYAPGEPVAGGGQCIEARPDGWHDDGCQEAKDYVCEYDGVPADPAAY